MINTLADLLKAFAEKENQKLNELGIKHPPTIGAMYEGLTESILKQSLFSNLNLVVAKSSFILGSQKEFDIILAEGEGERVPFTDKFIFAPKQVLVVIQVKKTFNAKEVEDSFENLMHIPGLFAYLEREDYMQRLATDSIHKTLQRNVDDYDKGLMSFEEEYIYHSLIADSQLPITIVIGYNGLKSEYSLREKFFDYLSEKVSHEGDIKEGYGPSNFPTLVICRENSIVKMDGHPYNAPISKSAKGWWDFLGSTNFNPMYLFLDVIWTKLAYKYALPPSIFGDDLETPKIKPFLSCQITRRGNLIGWNYKYHFRTKKELDAVEGAVEWEPILIDKIQYTVMNHLCVCGELELPELLAFEKEAFNAGYLSLDSLIQSLCNTGMVARTGDHKIQLSTRGFKMVMIGDKYYMGENNSGTFDNWLLRHSNNMLAKMPEKDIKK